MTRPSPRFCAPLCAILILTMAGGCAAPGPASGDPGGGGTPLDLAALLAAHPARFGEFLEDAHRHRLKIELSVVDETPEGPRLVRSSLSFGPDYFYPASSIKTCAVIAALVAIRELDARYTFDATRDTPLRFQPLFEGETVEESDPSHLAGGTITLAHEIAKVLLVSDNPAFNRLYEFAGPGPINHMMRAAGLGSTRIVHRTSEFRSPSDQLRTPAIDLLSAPGADGARAVLIRVPQTDQRAPGTNEGLSGVVFGRGHVVGSSDSVTKGPMDFKFKNAMSLHDLQRMNVLLLRPDVPVAGCTPFPLHPDDRAFISELMASTPAASKDPLYEAERYPDDYSKPFAPGLWRIRAQDSIEVRDKIGRAYGFTIGNCHVRDQETGVEFFLSAVLYTNENGIVGDGVYEYGRADRFFADLGEVVGRTVLGE